MPLLAAALGIFLYVQPDAPIVQQQAALAEIASAAISGFTLDVNWSDIDQGGGSFNWSAVDLYALPAVAAGLPLKVGLIAGNDTPAWLLARVPNALILSSGPTPTFRCESADEPAVWNTTF